MNDLLKVFSLVSKYFIRNWKDLAYNILLLWLTQLGYQSTTGFIRCLAEFLCSLWNSMREASVTSALNVLQNLALNPSGLGYDFYLRDILLLLQSPCFL